MRSTAKHWILAGAVTGVLVLSSGVANAQAPFTLLHSFTGTDGWLPASIIQGTDGNFYGTTGQGGTTTTSILGTVFKMTPAGVVTTAAFLHRRSGWIWPERNHPGDRRLSVRDDVVRRWWGWRGVQNQHDRGFHDASYFRGVGGWI